MQNNQGATNKFLRKQGDSKNNLGSSEKLLGEHRENNSGLNFEGSGEPRPPPCRGSLLHVNFTKSFHILFLIAWLADGDSLMCCIATMIRQIAKMFSTFSL